MAEAAAVVRMEFVEEGASDRELAAAAGTHDGGQEAGYMSGRVAVANNGWMAMVVTSLLEVVEVENGPAVVEENVEMTVEVEVVVVGS